MRHDFETRKEKIYDYIVNWHVDFGKSPSYRQIMKDTGTPSMQTVYDAVKALDKEGLIHIEHGHIVVPTKEDAGEEVKARILNTAFCGIPDYSDESIYSSVRLPVSLFGSDEKFLMKAEGDSMVERGIYEGDLLVVHPHGTIRPGAVVIAHFEMDGYVCKEYDRERGKVIFRSANHLSDGSPKYGDLVPGEGNRAEILGTVDETIHFVNHRLNI